MLIRSWIARLAQTRLTLVLALLVLFSLIHSGVVSLLRWRVQTELNSFASPIKNLDQFKRKLIDPLQNAAPFYTAAAGLCDKGNTPASQDLDALVTKPEDTQKQSQAVAAYRIVFDLMAQGHARHECVYGVRYQDGFSLVVPNFLSTRRLAVLMAARIRVATRQGDFSQACAAGAQGLRWIRTYEPNSSLIALMIRVMCANKLKEALAEVPPAQLTGEVREEAQWLKEEFEKSWELVFAGERLSAHKMYEGLISGRETAASLDSMAGSDGPTKFISMVYSVGGQPMILWDELTFLQVQKRIIAQPEAVAPAEIYGYLHPIASMLTPNPKRAHENLRKVCTELGALSGSK